MISEKLLLFFEIKDADSVTNREKAEQSKIIRRIAATDKSKSFGDMPQKMRTSLAFSQVLLSFSIAVSVMVKFFLESKSLVISQSSSAV